MREDIDRLIDREFDYERELDENLFKILYPIRGHKIVRALFKGMRKDYRDGKPGAINISLNYIAEWSFHIGRDLSYIALMLNITDSFYRFL